MRERNNTEDAGYLPKMNSCLVGKGVEGRPRGRKGGDSDIL